MQLSNFEWQGCRINVKQVPREWVNFGFSPYQLEMPTGAIAVTDYIAVGRYLFSILQIETVDGVDTIHLSKPQIWQDIGDSRITVRDMPQTQKSY